MKILSIETSCDDTGIAVVEAEGGFSNPKFKVLKNLVSSQVKIHRPFGGVVPSLAKREHIKNLPLLLKKLHPKPYTLNPDLIAVTVGPGLEPALWTGISFAQELRESLINADSNADKRRYKKIGVNLRGNPRKSANQPKLIGVNHLEGHLYSFLLPKNVRGSGFGVRNKSDKKVKLQTFRTSNIFPAVVLLVSGGHTALLLMKDLKTWRRLGETRDDAAGEAFDKVARMLGLPYPGGPEIERLAISYRTNRTNSPRFAGEAGKSYRTYDGTIDFPRPMLDQKNYDFSFSGLKTAVLYYLREHGALKSALAADVAASFQQAVIDVLVAKTTRAAKEYGARSVILCGGVAANKMLRENTRKAAREIGAKFFVPEMEYNNDNAAMIAAAGYFAHLKGRMSARAAGESSSGGKLPLKADGSLNI